MNYQDTWLHGRPIAKGYRECASRYALIHEFCTRELSGPFSVLDIGANQCYFGLRLVEDFDECRVLAFEYSRFAEREEHVRRADKTGRIELLRRRLSLSDIELMVSYAIRFDLILCLSVLHHVGGEFDRWITALRRLGKNVIAELAVEDCRSRKLPAGYRIPDEAVVLGYCNSHIRSDVKRPLLLIEGEKHSV